METLIYLVTFFSLYFDIGIFVLVTSLYWVIEDMPLIKMEMNSQLEFLISNLFAILIWPIGLYYIIKFFIRRKKSVPSEWD